MEGKELATSTSRGLLECPSCAALKQRISRAQHLGFARIPKTALWTFKNSIEIQIYVFKYNRKF
jgi:hypothetical protein